MVRLMAFKDSRTLRRSIITVTIYFSLIYFPLVLIFCCARVLLPGMEGQEDSIMPRMAVLLTENVGMGWLAGLLVAAPFAAVMSTVDSFLLVISSSVVRDIYQRNLNPEATEKQIKRLSYLSTLTVGIIALLGAVNPPNFLQDLIVYVGSGLAACFLFPILALLYVPRSNMPGCLAGMIGGFATHLGMHLIGWYQYGEFVKAYRLLGFDPVVVGLLASGLCVLIVTPLTAPPPPHLVRRYFYKNA
jgi:sodium/pantothenate symporter